MLTATIPIPGIDDTFTNKVTYYISKELIDLFKFNKDIKLNLLGTLKYVNMEDRNDDIYSGKDYKDNKSVLYVLVEEEFNQDEIYNIKPANKNFEPIFLNRNIEFEIKPIYVGVTLNFQFLFRTQSREEANRWYNDFRYKVSTGIEVLLHNIEYEYIIPRSISNLLNNIWEKTQNIASTNEDFKSFLEKNSDGRLSFYTDKVGKNIELGVKEKISRVTGFFPDNVLPPKPVKNDGETYYETDFTYKVYIDKPIELFTRYPIMVHQQLLEDKYIFPKDWMLHKDDYNLFRNYFDWCLIEFENQHERKSEGKDFMIRIPMYDNWYFNNPIVYHSPIFSVLLTIDENDRRSLFNLNDIPFIYIKKQLLNWIKRSELPYINKPLASWVYFGLVENNILYKDGTLTIDNDLNVKSTFDLDLIKVYRVVFSIVNDLTVLTDRAWESLKDGLDPNNDDIYIGDLTGKIICNTLYKNNLAKDTYNKIFKVSSSSCYERLNWIRNNFAMKTVQTSYVVALRKDNVYTAETPIHDL